VALNETFENASTVMNQTATTRDITIEWMETQSGQDRFYPEYIIVNQGDTVNLTFINNDTVAHDFVIAAPYNIMVNASMPGLYNDVTGQRFTTPALHNSPGVKVSGTPGNLSASYSFVAKYAGIYEYVCTYHVQIGMIGYLVVLPNQAYANSSPTQLNASNGTTAQSPTIVQVSIDAGSGVNVNLPGYSPVDITVVIGVNNTVNWTNNDNMPHTVTAVDGSFDSGNLNAGASFTHTFDKMGTFDYTCVYHHWMHGTVTVLPNPNSQNSETNVGGASGDYATYGLLAFGTIILLVFVIVFARPGRKSE
jgi:plastocyanin